MPLHRSRCRPASPLAASMRWPMIRNPPVSLSMTRRAAMRPCWAGFPRSRTPMPALMVWTERLPEFHVIGARDGWFLIEGAAYQEPGPAEALCGPGLGRWQAHHHPSVSRYPEDKRPAIPRPMSSISPAPIPRDSPTRPIASKRGESSDARARGSRSSSGCRGDGAYSAQRCREREHCAVGPTDPARNSRTGPARDRSSTIPGRRCRPA